MKRKKIIYFSILIFLVISIISLTFLIVHKQKSFKENGVLLGSPIENIKISKEYNDSFVYEYATATHIQKMIELDASKTLDGKIVKLSTLINNATFIVINVGTNDLTNYININSFKNTLSYDIEVLERQISIIISSVSASINSISTINNKCEIYLLNQQYPFAIYDETIDNLFNSLNESYEILANKHNINNIKL